MGLPWCRPLLVLLWLDGGCTLWRYTTTEENYKLFTSRTTIYLEYEGTSFTVWEFPDVCTAKNKSSPKTTLNCPSPGTYRIKPRVTIETFEDKERYLPVSDHSDCFMWYVTTASQPTRTDPLSVNESQELILWVYDPETADASERNHTAIRPSQSSQKLSKLFWNLGQDPVVHTYLKKDKYYSQEHPNLGLWTVNLPAVSEDIIINIRGKEVAFLECFVLDTPFIIPRPKQSFPSEENDTSLCSPSNSDISITWSACFPTTAVLLSDFGTFYTNDGFKTYEEIKVPSGALTQDLNNNVTDVTLTDNGILFLISGTIYKREYNHFFKLGAENKLPETEITGIQSRYWCSSIYPVQNGKQLSTLAAWTSNELYLAYNDIFNKIADTANLVKSLNFPDDAALSIETVSYDSVPSEIALLLICNGCSPSRLFYLAFYSESRQLWGLRKFYLPVPHSSVMRMTYLSSALSCGLLWDSESIYYTFKNNTTNGFFQVSGSNLSLSEMSNGSTIHQIILDYLGNILIKMKNNIFFYAKAELRELIQLPAWINGMKKMVLYLNPSPSVYVLLIDGSNIYRQTYPLETEIFSSTFRSEISCSVIAFEHNMDFNVYYLDMGDELTFWSQIVFEESAAISTYLEVYRPDLLQLKGSSKYEIVHGICTKNETFTFYHEIDYTLESNYTKALELTSGVASVELQPSFFEATCELRCQVSHVFVGCPPGRHIIVESSHYLPEENRNYVDIVDPVLGQWDGQDDLLQFFQPSFPITLQTFYIHDGKYSIINSTSFSYSDSCHIREFRPSDVVCQKHDFTTYRIPGKFLWHATAEDKIAYYDWDKYGCLMELHYERYFQPVISMYDGNRYVRRVETNFILWEMQGRSDYGYTSSMKEEGCLYKAQSWPMMLNGSKNSTLDEIWGPQNYRSCFVFHQNSTDEGLYEQYQILNGTSTNSIVWATSHSGIFVFRVRILDPNYSFCDLKAFFAVRTYGIIERPDLSTVMLYSFLILCVFWACLILSYFRYTKIFQELNDTDSQTSLGQQED